MVSRPSYLKHGNPHTWDKQSLYWDGALVHITGPLCGEAPDQQLLHTEWSPHWRGSTATVHSMYHGHFSSYNSRRTPHSSPVRASYGVLFVSANLTEVLSLSLLCCVHYLIIYKRDISRVYSILLTENSMSYTMTKSLHVKLLHVVCHRDLAIYPLVLLHSAMMESCVVWELPSQPII